MIGFNTLLESEDINPANVRLVRHQDTRTRTCSPYDFWITGDPRFDVYQNLQSGPVFGDQTVLASFVVSPLKETLFAGLYEIHGHGPAPQNMVCPVTELPTPDHVLYEMTPSPLLSEYRGKLVIDWGKGFIKWVQIASNQNKRVLEIRSSAHVPPFPGFLDFKTSLSELATVPLQWREILQVAAGIYVFVHPESGKQYVGSAQGATGFWGRWQQYLANGHGGNIGLIDIEPADYQIAILEVVSSNIGAEAVLEIENRWKEKLSTRKFGLNRN